MLVEDTERVRLLAYAMPKQLLEKGCTWWGRGSEESENTSQRSPLKQFRRESGFTKVYIPTISA